MIKYYCILISLFIFCYSYATIINIPADQPTIQAGIDVSVDGDTVLVQPGTYLENINFNGNNITVASLFLTTQDTIYISETVIDGDSTGSVVTFENGENSTAILSGFTIRNGSGTYADPDGNGYYHYLGGGFFLVNSNPNLENLQISENTIEYSGAGIYCYNSNPNLENIEISNNSAAGPGGGIYCQENSSIGLINVIIINNSSGSSGGGIYFHSGSNSLLENVVISENTADGSGGGIFLYSSETYLSGVTISHNSAESSGGGIRGIEIIFDSDNRCNIYSNSAQFGNDLYNYSGNTVNVIVDTFTVMQPTNFHAYPINRFSFDILHSINPQVNADLYVSPDGDNSNSGLSWDDPLKTINYALSIIYADSLNPHTIYLSSGTFSPSTNFESFPIILSSYITLSGIDEDTTIIDAENQHNVINCVEVENIIIENVSLTNGVGYWQGGGIYCINSGLDLNDMTVSNCVAGEAGGIYHTNSNSIFTNITVINNEAKHYGGIYSYESTLSIIDSDILANHADEIAGGIFCRNSETEITSTNIIGNVAGFSGGGLYSSNNSNTELLDVIISENSSNSGGGIYCCESNSNWENVTISYNNADYVGGGIYCNENSSPVFSENNRCSIYLNTSPLGNDLYSEQMMNVIVDTFTVMNPTEYHARPIDNFTFDILHGMLPQVNADLYVSPEGDDSNTGLSWDEPLRTINSAISRIQADSLNLHTIYLSGGVFCTETNGEIFPINFINYITLTGMGIDSTFINIGMENVYAFNFEVVQNASIKKMTITNSLGINCRNNSSPTFENLSISDNIGYGIKCSYNSDPIIKECLIINNHRTGLQCTHGSDPIVINSTISNNSNEYYSGAIGCYNNCHPILVNSILWNNCPQEIELGYGEPNSVTIAYCDIDNGESGIIIGNGTVNWLMGNIDADPLFAIEENDFHLTEDSPCIDAGTAFFEWQGNILLDMTPDEYVGDAPDMGAYEFDGSASDNNLANLTNKLFQNYPNPFNPSGAGRSPTTTISFNLTTEDIEKNTEIIIYNIKGQKVKEFLIISPSPGHTLSVTWDGTDDNNKPVSSGIYFYKLKAGDFQKVKKMILIK